MSRLVTPAIEIPLGGIPAGLRTPLLNAFLTIVRNYREARWEPAELNGGKLCEATISILQGVVAGSFPSEPTKPSNMVRACQELEKADSDKHSRSVRIQIPRVILGLYEVRNNRGVGHVGGDVNPNHMDAVYVLSAAKWIVAELVRIFHNVDTEAAAKTVDALAERTVPVVWEVGGKKRVLRTDLSTIDSTLLLLYGSRGAVNEEDLRAWVGYGNVTRYRKTVLCAAHRKRLLEYDEDAGSVDISPLGIRYVEERLPLDIPSI